MKHANLLCKVQKKIKNLNSKISKTKDNRVIMQSKCAVCGVKKIKICRKNKKQKVYWVI